jgi:trigger factor
LKIETTPRDDQQVQIVAEIDSAMFEDYKQRAARKISKETRIPGFRPGKAPYDIIRRHFGDDVIQREAIEIMLDDIYPKVLEEAKVEPSYPGTLEEILSYDPPKFSFLVPLEPEVSLPDYRAIRKEYKPELVTEEEVEEVLSNLQRNYATAEPVERPARDGDVVYLMLRAELIQPEESETNEFIQEMPHQVVVGEDDKSGWPFAGFSKYLTGMSANEQKEFTYTFPDDFSIERYRGKEARFFVTVQSVKELVLPELTDEFAQSIGEFETVEKLREGIRSQLVARKQAEYDDSYLDELIEEIVSQSTVKYPPQALQEEIEHLLSHLQEDLERSRMDLDTYLKTLQMDRDTFIQSKIQPQAQKSLTRRLVLTEIARMEKINVDSEELQKEVAETMAQFDQTSAARKSTAAQRRNLTQMVTIQTANRMFNFNLLERLKAIASGTYQPESEPVPETESAKEEKGE